jgi:hypothetical protein
LNDINELNKETEWKESKQKNDEKQIQKKFIIHLLDSKVTQNFIIKQVQLRLDSLALLTNCINNI